MKRALFLIPFTASFLFIVAMANADTISLGGTFNTIHLIDSGLSRTVGGGEIYPTTLNGHALSYDFCIALNTEVSVPRTYDAYITNNGYINTNNGTMKVNNAENIAYLLHTYASSPLTQDQQIAIQAAIWHFENYNVGLDSSYYDATSTIWQDYSMYISHTGTYSLGGFYWITPYESNTYLQAQIAPDPSVPEPSSLILLTLPLIVVIAYSTFKGAPIRQANQPVSRFLKRL